MKPSHEQYLIEIADWAWRYSFGFIGRLSDTGEPKCTDHRFLTVDGVMCSPAKHAGAAVTLILIPDHKFNLERQENLSGSAVGTLDVRNEKFSGTLCMPADVLSPLLSVLAASQLRFLTLSGERLRYRSATISYYRFEKSVDPDDWPDWKDEGASSGGG